MMKKNKKLLVSFLALNAILTSYTAGAPAAASVRYEKMYNNIVKNIEKGNSNEKNYQTIEKVLNQKNKELKDLYLQSDYIVKPEYLEWQVFFTGLYTERSRGDNTLENARYYSVSQTYSGKKTYNTAAYDRLYADLYATGLLDNTQLESIMSGHYNVINNLGVSEQKIIREILYSSLNGITKTDGFKTYEHPQSPKEIDLGINIPPKVINRQPLNPTPSIPAPPNVQAPSFVPATPVTPAVPSLTIKAFNPVSPQVDTPVLAVAPIFNIKLSSYCNSMTGCGTTLDGGAYNPNIGTARSYTGGPISGIIDGTSSVRHSWIIYDSTLLRAYFDLTNGSGSVTDFTDNLTIDSINPLSTAQKNAENTSSRSWNSQDFLVGGSRIATVDNVPNGAELNSHGIINLVGPLVVAFEMQTDNLGNGTVGLRNSGTITDLGETTSAALDTALAKGAQTTLVTNPMAGSQTITVKRTALGYTGYKVGLILTAENDAVGRHYNLINDGIINFQGEKSIGIQIFAPNYTQTEVSAINTGTITVGGMESYGMKLSSVLKNSALNVFENNGTINVTGGDGIVDSVSSGMAVLEEAGAGIRAYNNLVKNTSSGTINVSGSRGNTGMYLKIKAGDDITNEGIINVSGIKNAGIRVDYGSQGGLAGNPTAYNKTGSAVINITGSENFGMIAVDNNGTNGAIAENSALIEIKDTDLTPGSFIEKSVGMLAVKSNEAFGGYINNSGTIKINDDVKASQGMAVLTDAEGVNTGSIIISKVSASDISEGSVGVYNEGTFNMTGGLIDVSVNKGIGVYAKNNSADTVISGGIIRVADGAIGLYADDKGNIGNGATIKLTGTAKLEVNSSGLMLYNYSGTSGNPVGKFDMGAVINADINTGGTAFYFKGIPSVINSFLTNMIVGLGSLNIKLTSPTSSLFVLDNPGGIINLSDTTSAGIIGSLPANVTIDPSSDPNYKPYSVFKGGLNIDMDVNIDNSTDAYNRSEFLSSKVTLEAGKTMTSVTAGKYAIGQENYAGTLNRNEISIVVNNGGVINMTGSGSAGIIANFGEVINNGLISATGVNSIGIVSYNGSLSQNNNTITVGEGGTGIYGESKRNSSYGDGKIEIENKGLINTTAVSGGTSYGIYALNNDGLLTRADSTIKLFAGSEINMSSQDGGVGVSAFKSTLINDGKITVGKNGIAVYADNSEININSGEINLNGDNAIGFYLINSLFNGNSGTINVNGQNIVLFNLVNSTFTNNLTINAAPGSTYVIGNLSNAVYTHSGTNTLLENSVLLNGNNSAMLIDSSSNISSSSTGAVGMLLDGRYLLPFPAGYSAEGENAGTITLGSDSAAIYGKNGVRLKNSGVITLGSNSVGIYGTGTNSEIENTGLITLGNNSTGLYQKDGTNIINNNTINGTGSGAVALYTDSNTGIINNAALIDLQGDKSIGMYAGGGVQNIINTGTIKLGNSSIMNDPSIGIYTNHSLDTVINTGNIEVGSRSIGIYSLGTQVDHISGTVKAGSEGTGIYKDTGLLRIHAGAKVEAGAGESVGLYGINGTAITIDNGAIFDIGYGSYGIIAESGSTLQNSALITLGDNSIFTYGNNAGSITNNGVVNITGSDNTAFYMVKGGSIINNANITGTAGTGNIAVYNRGIYATETILPDGTMKLEGLLSEGYIENNADITLGDSFLVANQHGVKTGYSVGLYGDGASVVNNLTRTITVGREGVGIFASDAGAVSYNYGTIIGNGDKAIGMFADNTRIENHGLIQMTGDGVIGMAGRNGAYIYNNGTIQVTGKDVTGIYLSGADTKVENKGQIIITNTGSASEDTGVGIRYTSDFDETGNIIGGIGNISGTGYVNNGYTTAGYSLPEMPTLINSGEITIDVGNKFSYDSMRVIVKLDPSTNEATTNFSDTIGFSGTTIPEKLEITADFSQGTSADRYTFKNIFRGMDGTGEYISQSLTWDATGQGLDIVMTRLPYTKFTDGLWYEDFGRILNEKYANQTGDALKIYDKIDMIQTEPNFRHSMASLAGNVYANINQREEDMARVFENSLHVLQNSENNTKENVKINVIAVKGKTEEDTDGVVPYKYTATGAIALREVERTYRHTFAYSLGYLHTGFEFEDHNNSEEWVDTIQLGVHNKYTQNGWKLKNDLTGRISFHNVDRNIDWPNQTTGVERSEMNGTFETYSLTSDNILGKEITLGKKASIMPYGAFRAMYVTRPDFSESGMERLEVEGNDAWSAKPRIGVELKTTLPLGAKTAWQFKGSIDAAYEYELADLNEREKARLIAIEDGYHKLSKPEDEKGSFRTRASLGVEVDDRYGIYITGEYLTGNDDQEDYRAGLILKAVF
jgi:hypothetical protein